MQLLNHLSLSLYMLTRFNNVEKYIVQKVKACPY
jgi:hypothetical protein